MRQCVGHGQYLILSLIVFFLIISPAGVRAGMPDGQPNELRVVEQSDPPPSLLSEEEVNKIATLQNTMSHRILSPINPSGQAVLIGESSMTGGAFGILDLRSGSFRPLKNQAELARVEHFIDIQWVTNNRLATYALVQQGSEPSRWMRVEIDRLTRKVSLSPVTLEGTPVSLSPQGRYLLSVDEADSSGQFLGEESGSPTAIVIPLNPYAREEKSRKRPQATVMSTGASLFVLDLTSGEKRLLGTLPPGTTILDMGPSPFAWSKDAGKLGFVRTVLCGAARGRDSLFEILTRDSLGKYPREENPLLQENVLEIFDLQTGETRQLKARDGNGDIFGYVSWSPKGDVLLAVMKRPDSLLGRDNPVYNMLNGAANLYYRLYDAGGNQIETLDKPEIANPYYQIPLFVSSDEILFPAINRLTSHVYLYDRKKADLRRITSDAGSYYGVTVDPQSRKILFTYSSFLTPPELYCMKLDGAEMAAVTKDNVKARKQSRVQVHRISFELADGVSRHAYLIQPAGRAFPPKNEPMVMWQNGGPGGEMINSWYAAAEAPFNLLPNFGISVLMLPLEMRPGWGEKMWLALADGKSFGQIDIDEAAEFVKRMIGSGYTSSQKIGISGCSYGGYFTSQSITRHPGLYAAANPACSLLDLPTEFSTGYTSTIGYLMGRTPYEDLDEYVNDSPIYGAGEVSTPTLVFHGSEDFLPVGTAQNFYTFVAARGTPARMVEFMGEPHGVYQPQNVLYQAQEQINWFRYFLGAQELPQGGKPVASSMQ